MATTVQTLLVFCLFNSVSGNFWEYLVGPRLGNALQEHQEPKYQTTEQIVKSYGYRLETHSVESQTGHILTLHRIPRGLKSASSRDNAKNPIIINHGLMGCSDMWLTRGPKLDLPFVLADSGYDVWLTNIRGNVHSRRHKFLNPDVDAAFWDFGIEDIGHYDLPATIDYVLAVTKQKDLYFAGHSIGSSAGFIACSLLPEYNDKIRLFLALGPLANVKHPLTPFHHFLFTVGAALVPFSQSMNVYEIMPRRPYISDLLYTAFEDGSPLHRLALMSMGSLVGNDISEYDSKTFLRFVHYYPAGTSMRVLEDVFRYYLTGKFNKYDYGDPQVNKLHYNSTKPPDFDLSKVKAPVSIYYGPGDLLVAPVDARDLARKLPNVVELYEIPHKQFTHMDFVLAVNARRYLYDSLVRLMDKYKH